MMRMRARPGNNSPEGTTPKSDPPTAAPMTDPSAITDMKALFLDKITKLSSLL